MEAEKARLQQTQKAEAARAREEAERRAAAATAAAMEEAEAKLRRKTPPGGSRVETLRKIFEGDASSKMALDPEEVDTGSSGSSGPTAYRRRKGKGKTPERARRPAGGHPNDSDPFFTASDGDERGRRHHRGVAGGGGGDVPMQPVGEDEDPPPPYRSSESSEAETPRCCRAGVFSPSCLFCADFLCCVLLQCVCFCAVARFCLLFACDAFLPYSSAVFWLSALILCSPSLVLCCLLFCHLLLFFTFCFALFCMCFFSCSVYFCLFCAYC